MWIEQGDVFYNLDKFNQIQKGDPDEILLANIRHNADWDDEDEKNICVLKYESQEERDLAWEGFRTLLELQQESQCK